MITEFLLITMRYPTEAASLMAKHYRKSKIMKAVFFNKVFSSYVDLELKIAEMALHKWVRTNKQ